MEGVVGRMRGVGVLEREFEGDGDFVTLLPSAKSYEVFMDD